MLSLLINTAYAAEATPAVQGGMGPFVMMIIIFAIFYLIVIRPNQKQQKKHKQMLSEIKKGDDVVTNSGIHGRVVDVVDDHVLMVQVANNVVLKFERAAVQHVKGYVAANAKSANNNKKAA